MTETTVQLKNAFNKVPRIVSDAGQVALHVAGYQFSTDFNHFQGLEDGFPCHASAPRRCSGDIPQKVWPPRSTFRFFLYLLRGNNIRSSTSQQICKSLKCSKRANRFPCLRDVPGGAGSPMI
ncbi:hypothetical protein ACTGJ9_038800 [Bradyrhizobium sp. RDM12]